MLILIPVMKWGKILMHFCAIILFIICLGQCFKERNTIDTIFKDIVDIFAIFHNYSFS